MKPYPGFTPLRSLHFQKGEAFHQPGIRESLVPHPMKTAGRRDGGAANSAIPVRMEAF
jgi:hypothetical protein